MGITLLLFPCMALLSTEQFERAMKGLKSTLKRVRNSWPARVLSGIHHDAYQRVQADQTRLESDLQTSPDAPLSPASSKQYRYEKRGARSRQLPPSR